MGLFGSSNTGFNDGGDNPVVQTFTANGTWSCCPGAIQIDVIVVGGGAGGNSGGLDSRVNLTNTRINIGGAGGGGGGLAVAKLTAGQIPTTACVVVGTGGAGGIAHSTNCRSGYVGNNGGNSCFGSCVVANGGVATNSGAANGGGYNYQIVGGQNNCPGVGGTAVINTGSGTTCTGNNGGGMGGQSGISQPELFGNNAQDAGGTRTRGGGGGGGSSCCALGLGGTSVSGTTICGICLGQGGAGGGPSGGGVGSNGSCYGAGGGGGHAQNTGTACKGGDGFQGVVKVIQYFR
jgi:hypothetical protein